MRKLEEKEKEREEEKGKTSEDTASLESPAEKAALRELLSQFGVPVPLAASPGVS